MTFRTKQFFQNTSLFKKAFYLLVFLCFVSQFSFSETVKVSWEMDPSGENHVLSPHHKTQGENNDDFFFFTKRFSSKIEKAQIKFSQLSFRDIDPQEKQKLNLSSEPKQLQYEIRVKHVRGASIVEVLVNPYVSVNGVLNRVISFDYELKTSTNLNLGSRSFKNQRTSGNASTTVSNLKTGTFFKIAVVNTGVHKIDKTFLQTLGVDPSTINPDNIRIYGNSTGMLPELNSTPVEETLQESAIYVAGASDGNFDDNDYILFYGKGPHAWDYDASRDFYSQRYNLYSDTAYYFINFDKGAGKRISSEAENGSAATSTISSFDDFASNQNDLTNLLQTGKDWFGEYYDISTSYTHQFSFPNINTDKPLKVKGKFAVRSFTSTNNTMTMKVNGSTLASSGIVTAVGSHYEDTYARDVEIFDSISTGSQNISIQSIYSKPEASSVAWLDFITVNVSRDLRFTSGQLDFRSAKSVGNGNISEFEITSSSDVTIWDVSDPLNVKSQSHQFASSKIKFKRSTDELLEFIAFDNNSYYSPIAKGIISNQNILGHLNKPYIIICPSEFRASSQDLVDFHEEEDNIKGAVVTTEQIYNEFSSGAQDVTAIRNFLKYLYENSSDPVKYVLLMGDGSYDFKNRVSGNTNFVPSYQSAESLNPLTTFSTDDYFAMLDDAVSIESSSAAVDIAVGRFPGSTVQDVQGFVEKVKSYTSDQSQTAIPNCTTTSSIKSTFGSWKNNMLFVADDGNSADGYSSSHLYDTDSIVSSIWGNDSSFNVKKVYMDSYSKISGPGGGTYPAVTDEIMNTMEQGTFAVSYIGHGGEAGWADERILEADHVRSWTNLKKLPIFLTATCEFSRYDNPELVSAGEYVITNSQGGAIAMMTTVRLVFGGFPNNIGFSIEFFDNLLDKQNNITLGDASMQTKINTPAGSGNNNRKFVLLGDPAMKIGLPTRKIRTLSIQNSNGASIDTLSALSKIKVSGEVVDENDVLDADFNGILYPTVYDAFQKTLTLDNNQLDKVDSFYVQKNILFNGAASVSNGKFDFEFIVPKDISYSYKSGKLSYYAANQTVDASGSSSGFVVGGTSTDYVPDETSPTIELFMNDSNFVDGGLTDESPTLIAVLTDESGINTSGAGLGHDISAVLDQDYSNKILLNEFYSAKIDDYTSGTVNFPMRDLSEGPHQITVKAWDIFNNSAEATMEFYVSNSSELALKHVLNYPNPFTTRTDFMFEHNYACNSIEVMVQIFTVSGKLIKTILQTIPGSGGFKGNAISWDGKDDYGDQIGKGVYVYRLTAKTDDGKQDSKLEKLVILK